MSNIQFQPPYTVLTTEKANNKPENKQCNEVSVRNWFCTLFILLIPIVNFIMLFVWSFSKKTNLSKRNFSRAMLILSIICYSIAVSVLCFMLVTNMLYF